MITTQGEEKGQERRMLKPKRRRRRLQDVGWSSAIAKRRVGERLLKSLGRTKKSRALVEEALAADGAAETRNAVVAVDLALELVVVRELLVWMQLVSCQCQYQSHKGEKRTTRRKDEKMKRQTHSSQSPAAHK